MRLDYPLHEVLIDDNYRYKIRFQGASHHFILDVIYLVNKVQVTSTHGSAISNSRMSSFLSDYNPEEIKEKLIIF